MGNESPAELFLTVITYNRDHIHQFIKKLQTVGIHTECYPTKKGEFLLQCQWVAKKPGRPVQLYYTADKQAATCGFVADIMSAADSNCSIITVMNHLIDVSGHPISESTFRRRLKQHLQNKELYSGNPTVF